MPNRPGTQPADREAPTLTDRYVAVATRGLSDEQRRDVEAELRATVADMVDDRLATADAGDPAARDGAERAALRALGDPERLSDAYRGAGRYLVGPAVYGEYRRVLRAILPVVPPLAGGAAALAQTLAGEPAVEALLSGLWIAFLAATQVLLWVTVVFAVVERSEEGQQRLIADSPRPPAAPGSGWDVDRLPATVPDGRLPVGEAVASIVIAVVTIGFLVWQRDATVLTGDAGPLLNPALWDVWLPLVVGALAASVVLELVRLRVGTPWPVAATALVINAVIAAPFVLALAGTPLLNPAVTGGLTGDSATWLTATISLAVLLVLVWDSVDEVRRTRTQGRRSC